MDPQQPAPNPINPLPAQKKHMAGRTKLALWLMIGPTALLVVSFLLFAIVNFVASTATPAPGELFAEQSAISPIVNVLLFLIGIVTIVTWLPGLIIGIVLLATKPTLPHDSQS